MSLTAPFALVPGLLAARQEAGNPARVRDLPFCSFSIHSVNRPRARRRAHFPSKSPAKCAHRVWRGVANVALTFAHVASGDVCYMFLYNRSGGKRLSRGRFL
jgi:hypothetical protein